MPRFSGRCCTIHPRKAPICCKTLWSWSSQGRKVGFWKGSFSSLNEHQPTSSFPWAFCSWSTCSAAGDNLLESLSTAAPERPSKRKLSMTKASALERPKKRPSASNGRAAAMLSTDAQVKFKISTLLRCFRNCLDNVDPIFFRSKCFTMVSI